MAGQTLASFGLTDRILDHIAVKEAVFPFARFAGVDTVLGPEMRSTGEVMGIDRSFDGTVAGPRGGLWLEEIADTGCDAVGLADG